jgi:hypothetical protein
MSYFFFFHHAAAAFKASPTQTLTQGPPGGAPLPPYWFYIVHDYDFSDSPRDYSSADLNCSNVTNSTSSIWPFMLNILYLTYLNYVAYSAALQLQHFPSHVCNDPVFGICWVVSPWLTKAPFEKTWF